MDTFVLEVKPQANLSMIVKLDDEAAKMIYNLQMQSGADKKYIVSEMIKFCYPRCKIKQCGIEVKGKGEHCCEI